jgi:hypothetical protein
MKHLLLRRRDTEAVLDGTPVDEDSPLGDVDAFLTTMRTEFAAMPAPEPRPTLAATLDGRRELRPASGPLPKPTFPERKPRLGLRPVGALLATGAVLFGGLATAGALPASVQRTTADASAHIGIHLPGATTPTPATHVRIEPGTGHHDPTTSSTRSTTSSTGSITATTVPGANATTVPPAVPVTPPTTVVTPPSVPTLPTLPVPLPNLTPSGTAAQPSPRHLKQLLHSKLLPNPLSP